LNTHHKMLSLLSIIVLSVVFSQSFMSVRAQSEEAIVVILPSAGGTTSPGPGTYAYPNGTNIVLSATPSSGYEFKYWIASGNYTPGHTAGQGVTIVDPETGEVIGGFPRPQFSGIDSLVFTANPANITCGYGYTYYYQAVFAPVTVASPSPEASVSPTTSPTQTISESPTTTETPNTILGVSPEVFAIIVIVVIIIIAAVIALVMRKKKT